MHEMTRTAEFQIGLFALAFSAFLFLYGIPNFVTSPANVRNIVLSPVFWPNILAGALGLAGLALVAASTRAAPPAGPADGEDPMPGGGLRLGLMAVLMFGYAYAIPILGMVWASMIVFAASAFIMRTSHPVSALAAAVCVPLLLYGFFAHVASVAVPQGEFIRLP